jgi:hypothetical protein
MRLAGMICMLLAFATGCVSDRSLYYWGHYEDLIYLSYSQPGKAPAEEQVIRLEEDFQKARSLNKKVPPGYHAYLGCLYVELGKIDQARQEFESEKRNFPESTVFMNRLQANLNKP